MGHPYWKGDDYFASLLKNETQACLVLEHLVDDLHLDKENTVNSFLRHAGSEDLLWALVKHLGSSNPRMAGNSAYILGTIAECGEGCRRVISLAESRHAERKKILPDLVAMLGSKDAESIMNAAGTIGTLAETDEGRDWLLREVCITVMIEKVTLLLNNENQWTASNAALVLARLTISEKGCELLLDNQASRYILSQLIGSLGTDEAGRGMNAAFAIGRLCDLTKGRAMLLSTPEANKMVTHLGNMLCSEDSGSSKNACFAISCLAASQEGHEKLLNNSLCERVMNTLAKLLSSEDYETGWFAAMTLRTFSSRPMGCLKLRESSKVVPALTEAANNSTDNDDMHKEVVETLEILKLLNQPAIPEVSVNGARQIHVSWKETTTKSGLSISYKLMDGPNCVYYGPDTEVTLNDLTPSTTFNFKLRALVQGDNSPFSDTVTVATEEDVPFGPSNLCQIAATPSQLKIGWEPPAVFCGNIKSYYVYNDGASVEHTTDFTCIISGLKESTDYTITVCAVTSKGKGNPATLLARTSNAGDHSPSKPVISSLGRNEMNVSWNPPEVPLGRITRYDVLMNSKVIYSGTELHCQARHLTPNTEYTFLVTVITNEGRQNSLPSKKRSAKDEYEHQRVPLYVPPIKREDTKADLEVANSNTRKKKKRRPSLQEKASSARPSHRVKKSPVPMTSSGITANKYPATEVLPLKSDVVPSPAVNISAAAVEMLNDTSKSQAPERQRVHKVNVGRTISLPSSAVPPAAATLPSTLPTYTSSANQKPTPKLTAKEYDKLTRSLTKLNIATFEPVLPVRVERSSTFAGLMGSKRSSLPNQSQKQMNNGPSAQAYVCGQHTVDGPVSTKRPTKSPPGRFVPMQYRTQPMNLPNVQKFNESDPGVLRRGTSMIGGSTFHVPRQF